MTRSTTSVFGSGFPVVTVSRADTVEVETPSLDWLFGDWRFGLGRSVLFKAKTARVAQSSNPATDLK
jgi:hypothetical protein